jgi:hypothetical protein
MHGVRRLYWPTYSSPGNGKQSLPHVYGSLRRILPLLPDMDATQKGDSTVARLRPQGPIWRAARKQDERARRRIRVSGDHQASKAPRHRRGRA